MASSDVSDEDLQSRFGPQLSIPAASVVALAADVRYKVSGRRGCPADQLVSRLSGSYNLVHIVRFEDDVKYVVRLPAVGWASRLTEAAQRALRSQALTMRFLEREAMLPLPDVYAFDTTTANTIGAPYMVMSFIPGATVGSRWFDSTGPTPLEERRQRTLDTLAEAMCRLQGLQFGKIGSLEFNDETGVAKPDIGPCYRWDEGSPGDQDFGEKLVVEAFGPFATSQDYFRMDRETFVLAPPDFDSQNIMIDERGNVTGIIDWDNVQTEPRFLGFSRFPSWITRDWDPLMYSYPQSPRENSPDQLKQFRARYDGQMQKNLHGRGDARWTKKSHIFEAVSISAMDSTCRLEIVRKIVDRIVPRDEDYDALDVIEDVGRRRLASKDMDRLTRGFAALLSIGRW
ncbi:MAG: hypothetical protein M1832_001367 [Thelocarpon impressellum]|nr:MAG: hypothetical protein M1832_001367 [Thelocarpon impressellum]